MIEVITHIDVCDVPCPGTAGHVSGSEMRGKTSQKIYLEKLKNLAASGCPVNKKIPTKMTRKSFIEACNHHRTLAETDRNRNNKFAIITMTGFKSNNKRMCVNCERGERIKSGEPFEPPFNVTFIELNNI